MLRKFFGKKKKLTEEEEEKLENNWFDEKSRLMESILAKEHDMVMHALIPYEVGGGLDLYYYPNGIPGTAIATKELSYACRESSSNDKYKKYELVMFTREKLNLDQAKEENATFGKAHKNINSILNPVANYSKQATLNPNETCEFPSDMEGIGGKCLIFSEYKPASDDVEDFGLMAVIEIHRSEMEYAMQNGGRELLNLLEEKGYYPYSDMDREPVV
ncbi:MAG: suppressor of fused domain protein [Deltaproteobacteria bacterium]|nr:suppressor of fused domain protein [Deltaproteobacteria bacterium]